MCWLVAADPIFPGYHLGVTFDYTEGGRRWYHKVPTGPVTVVSSVTPTHEMMYRFLHLVQNLADMGESLGGIPLPTHVRLRWSSRQKELTALTQLAMQKSAAGGAA